jgi:molecular chaperone DnaK (HSP70)
MLIIFRYKYISGSPCFADEVDVLSQVIQSPKLSCDLVEFWATRTLSSAAQTSIQIAFRGYRLLYLSHSCSFRKLCQDLFYGTLDLVEKVLRDSKIDKSNVHEIILVGSSTRIPCIVKLVSDFFNGVMFHKLKLPSTFKC